MSGQDVLSQTKFQIESTSGEWFESSRIGIQTGLLEFIPYLGSVIAAIPIFPIALPLGTFTVVVALALYAIFHILVGAVVLPLIQKQTLDLPPAIAVASLALFGALFGLLGVVVATPLVIIIRQATLHVRQRN